MSHSLVRFHAATPAISLILGLLLLGSVAASGPRGPASAAASPAFFTHRIHEVQGSGSTSPLVGMVVIVEGIVTARRSNGFFLQERDADADAVAATSEAIFVFTSSAPIVTVGNRVQVTGTVSEFVPSGDPSSPSVTQLSSPSTVTLSTGNALPVPVSITANEASPSGALEQLERFEGMRVEVASLTVVAPTEGIVNETSATSTTTGVFHGVVTGVARPFREPGIRVPDVLPVGAPAFVPRFDANPELIRVDSDGQVGVSAIQVATGAIVTGLEGVLDYASRSYTVLPDATPDVIAGPGAGLAVRAPAADEFTIASFNVQRLFDNTDDPGSADPVLTPTAYQLRLGKLSAAVRDGMQTPDILGLVSVEKLAVLQDLADRINADAVAAGRPDPAYEGHLFEGNDANGIDVGFLVKGARVTVTDVVQQGKNATYVNPTSGVPELTFDSTPLLLHAEIVPDAGAPFPVTVLLLHLRSQNGIGSTTDGPRVRAKRAAQAEYVAGLLEARQIAAPSERIVVVGDFNAFEFNDGYVDVVGTVRGAPAPASEVVLPTSDLVSSDLANLVETVDPSERYSFVLGGSAMVLDHALVNGALAPYARDLGFARLSVDYPESFRSLPNRGERVSDHDALVSYFGFSTPTAVDGGIHVEPGMLALRTTPNPTRGATSVAFTLAVTSDVTVEVYDIAGRNVAQLFNGPLGEGAHTLHWNGQDRSSRRVGAGLYFVRLQARGLVSSGRIVVLGG